MAGEILDILEDDARDIFIADFAETIAYKPRVGAERSIQAVVDRQPPQSPGAVQRGPLDRLQISVINSAVDGIDGDELDLGGDAITVARRVGETATDLRIVSVGVQDRGLLELELT